MLSSLDWIDQETEIDQRKDVRLSLGYADRSIPGMTWLHRTDLVSSQLSSAAGSLKEEKLLPTTTSILITGIMVSSACTQPPNM